VIFKVRLEEPITLYCDDKLVISITRNILKHDMAKHTNTIFVHKGSFHIMVSRYMQARSDRY